MNKHYILSLFDQNLKTVGATFKGGTQVYTYKTYEQYAVGDYAVVHTPSNGFQVVEITVLHETPDIDSDSKVDYKWLIQKVDVRAYDAQNLKDEGMFIKVKEAQRNAHRESARAALLAKVPSLGILEAPANAAVGLTKMANGLSVDSNGAFYHPDTVLGDNALRGPFESVKEAMAAWNKPADGQPTHDV